jgi:hypothetical protein
MVEPARAASKISLFLADAGGALVTAERVLTPRAGTVVGALQTAGLAFPITSAAVVHPVELLHRFADRAAAPAGAD